MNELESASPADGTLTAASVSSVVWTGNVLGFPPSPEGRDTCTPLSCDTFKLTLSGTPGDWAGKQAQVVISWPTPTDDYDVYINKGSANGPSVGSSAASGGGPETVKIDPNAPNVGTGDFYVTVVYWLVVPDPITPSNYQYTGTASVVGAATPTPSPSPGSTPTPTPVAPGTPRFVNHYAPPSVMEDAGEPTMGVNWNSEDVGRGIATAFANKFRTGVINPEPNGGTSLYYGGINNFFLRATFDDCSSPALVQWDQMPLTTGNATRAFYDPILYTDHWTGRTFVCQELGLTPGGSTVEWTDNDGDVMYLSQGGAPSGGIDHQTIGGGPFHAPTPAGLVPTPKIPLSGTPPVPDPLTVYPHAVYYASQSIATATSQLSLDGGFTFPVQAPMFTIADCAGLHGHVKVAEDGTAYLPDKACAPAGVPFVNGGNPSVVVSEDNGATWTVRPVPGAASDAGVDDPSVGVSWCPPGVACDKADRSNHIYMGFMYTGGRPGVAYSNNKGASWVRVTDLSLQAPFIKHIAFPMVAVGDPGRAAFAFLGTLTEGNYSAPEFPGVWHLYIATTDNFGETWTIQNLSPEGPVQRGGVCGDGTCRNLLDFQDIQIDKRGRILIAGQDGCVGGCELGGPNSFTAKAYISRQSGGKRMFSIYDTETAEPAVPGAPNVTAAIDTPAPGQVTLTWPVPDHGGSPIIGYNVYRSDTASPVWSSLTPLATVIEPSYTDATPLPGDEFYIVTALNAVGESPYCKVVAPIAVELPDPCNLPGVLVSNDILPDGSDNDAPANVPVDPRVNARQLFVAEPFIGGGVEELVFTLQVAPSTMGSAPPNSQWLIVWNRQGPNVGTSDRVYTAMTTDAAGTPEFEYGAFGGPLALPPEIPDPGANTPTPAGNSTDNPGDISGSYDPLSGVIRIRIKNTALRAIDGAGNYVATRSLTALNVRTYFNRPDYPFQRSQNNASDITPDGSYTMFGNNFCALAPKLLDVFSRKTHGMAGNFDLRLGPLLPGASASVECRRGSGASNNNHQIVFVFATPVTLNSATVTPGPGKSAAVGSVSTSGNEVIVNLTGVSNAQLLTINLFGLSAGSGSLDLSIPMGVLLADSAESGRVDSGDLTFVRQQNLRPLEKANFRADVNFSGRIDSADVTITRQQNLTGLP